MAICIREERCWRHYVYNVKITFLPFLSFFLFRKLRLAIKITKTHHEFVGTFAPNPSTLPEGETRSYPRDIERKRAPIRNGSLQSLRRAQMCFLLSVSFLSLMYFLEPISRKWMDTLSRTESETHGRKAWLAHPGIISSVIAMPQQSFYKNGYSPMEINGVCVKWGFLRIKQSDVVWIQVMYIQGMIM